MNPRIYALCAGVLLLIVALVEISTRETGSTFVVYTTALAAIHAVAGIVGIAGFVLDGRLARICSQVIGSVALGLAIMGFVPSQDGALAASILGAPLPMFETVAHLLLGVAGIFAGFGRVRE